MTALGLCRIILIDSFITNKSIAISLDEHANLSGTNGAGKTTCLRLIPFFYGMEPGQLENQAAGKKSFVDWYLPRQTSLIIFEYARADGLCCSVVYRHPSGTKPAYRFKRGGYDDSDFCLTNAEGNQQFCKGVELASHWRSLDIEFSSQLEIVVDYRAIIQQDRELLNRSQRAKQLRPLASRYCLGDSKSRSRHLEKIALAILGRQGSMEKIKLMLADIMQEDGLQIPMPPRHKDNKLIGDDLASLRDFKSHTAQFKQLLSTSKDLTDSQQELAEIHYSLKHHQHQLQLEQVNLQQQQEQQLQVISNQDSQWRNQRDKLQATISRINSDASELDNKVNQLQANFEHYEAKDASWLNQEFEQLTQLKSQWNQARNNYQELTDNVKTEQTEFEQKKSIEQLRHQKVKEQTQLKIHSTERDLNQQKEQHLTLLSQMETQFYQLKETDYQQAQLRREKLLTEKIQTEQLIDNATASESQQDELMQLNLSIDTIETTINQLELNCQSQETELHLKKQDNDIAEQEYLDAKQQLASQQQQLDSLLKWLKPDTASWLYQLQQTSDNWHTTLGKLIKPEVLLNNTLKPSYSQESMNCYGWQLDLSKLATEENQSNNQQQLSENIERLQQLLIVSEKRFEKAKQDSKKSQELCQSLEKIIDETKRQLRMVKQQKNALRENTHQLQQIINDSIADRKLQAKQLVKELTAALDNHDTQHQSHLAQKQHEHQQAKQQQSANWSITEDTLKQLLQSYNATIDDDSKLHQQNLNQIQAQFDALLHEKGFDTQLIAQAKQQSDALSHRIEAIESNNHLIQEYRHFIKHEWPKKSATEQTLDQRKKELLDAELGLKQATAEHQLTVKALVSKKTNTEKKITDNNTLLSDIETLLNQLTQRPIEQLVELPKQSLIQRARELIKQEQKLIKQVTDGIFFVENEINLRSQSQIALAWQQECQAIIDKNGLDTTSPEHVLHLPAALNNLIEVNIPQLEQTLIETSRVIGNQLNLFYQGLQDINHHLKTQANKISQLIEQYTLIDALANIKIDMKSKIEELDYWQQLQQFSTSWSNWQSRDESQLPPPELITNFAGILTLLDKARLNQTIASLFNLHIHLEENGRAVVISNDNDLLNASSAGLSYLALCAIFVGITRLLCPNKAIAIHWPVDELGIIAPENINHLFAMLKSAGIIMFGGFPNTDPDLLKHFSHKHLIDRQSGIKVMNVESTNLFDKIKLKQARAASGELS